MRIRSGRRRIVSVRLVARGGALSGSGGAEGFPDSGQHVAEDAQQPFRFRAVFFPQLLELVQGLAGDGGHPLAEQGDYLIPGAGAGGMHHTGQQRPPLVLTGPGQLIDVEDRGFPGEVTDLRRRQAGQPPLAVPDAVQPGQKLSLIHI